MAVDIDALLSGQNYEPPILRRIDQLLGTTRQPSRRRQPKQDFDFDFTPEEQQIILGQVGSAAMSGLGMLGSALDLPASMARDVVTLNNPLDQLLDPLGTSGRISGRDVLTQWGATKPNDPDRWEWEDVAGGTFEALFDPLMFLTAPGQLTKAGRLTKAAGLSDDAAQVVKATGKGKRVGGMETTLQSVVDANPAAREAIDRAAKAGRYGDVEKLLQQPLRSTGGIGSPIPYADPLFEFGEYGKRFAGWLDTIGQAARWSMPGRLAAMMIDSSNMGRMTREGQEAAQEITRKQRKAKAGIRGETAQMLSELDQAGQLGDDNMLRGVLEGVEQTADPTLQRAAQRVESGLSEALEAERFVGVPVEQLDDVTGAKYAPRSAVGFEHSSAAGRGRGPLIADLENAVRREDWTRNFKGATPALREMISDPNVLEGSVDDAVNYLAKTYGDRFVSDLRPPTGGKMQDWILANSDKLKQDPEFMAEFASLSQSLNMIGGSLEEVLPAAMSRGANWGDLHRRAEELYPAIFQPADKLKRMQDAAHSIRNLTDAQRDVGLFGNAPLADVEARRIAGANARIVADQVADTLAGLPSVQGGEALERGVRGTTVSEMLQRAGLELGDANTGALQNLARKLGLDPTQRGVLEDIGRRVVPDEVAKDLGGFFDGFKVPQAMDQIVKGIDSFQNIFKGMVTGPWPAFHMRNMLGGQFNNALIGLFAPRAMRDAGVMISGGVVKEAERIPVIASMLAERGMPATSEAGTQLLRELAYQHEIVGRAPGVLGSTVGDHITGGLTRADDMLAELPGRIPATPAGAAKKLAGAEGSTWNPLKAEWRGVGDGQRNTFSPLAAGDEMNSIVEGSNRLTPFIEALRKGIDPAEAARRIAEAHVDYSARNWTDLQRNVIGRMFPFSKFTMGQIGFTARQLADRPAGPLAQTIRAADRARGDNQQPVPDYIAQTAAIPLGESQDGGQRYLTGLGLPFEDVTQFIGGPRETGIELLSRMNPLIKAPLEWATGETFFQRGPGGGRAIEDLDPTIGRTLANIMGRDDPVKFPGSTELEFLIGNSPLARVASTARTATDPRKGLGARAMNLGTGLRVSDISPGAQDAVIREYLQQMMKEAGAGQFTRVNFRPEDIAKMPREQQIAALRMQALANVLAERAKGRRSAAAE